MSEITSNKKARLGRGIGSLLGGAEIEESQPTTKLSTPAPTSSAASQAMPVMDETQKIWSVGIERIVPNTRQPRKVFNAEDLKELTASIKEKGILQPIVARRTTEGKIEIIAGERRWRAAQA